MQRNPLYSLRSFARDLALNPAQLSGILNGKTGLSAERAKKIGKRLGLNAQESALFSDLVESTHARSKTARELARVRLRKYDAVPAHQQLQLDAFRLIADWYHYGILELLSVEGFRNDPAWIGRALGIAPMEARLALERLERLELIERKSDGSIVARDAFTAGPDGIPSDSIRKHHQQILEKAQSALVLQSVEQRDFSSVVLAIDPDQIPLAKARIKEFRRALNAELEASSRKKAVYCLSVQFFELTQSLEEP